MCWKKAVYNFFFKGPTEPVNLAKDVLKYSKYNSSCLTLNRPIDLHRRAKSYFFGYRIFYAGAPIPGKLRAIGHYNAISVDFGELPNSHELDQGSASGVGELVYMTPSLVAAAGYAKQWSHSSNEACINLFAIPENLAAEFIAKGTDVVLEEYVARYGVPDRLIVGHIPYDMYLKDPEGFRVIQGAIKKREDIQHVTE